jgi:hypothetical protein
MPFVRIWRAAAMARARSAVHRLRTHYSYLYKNSNTIPYRPIRRMSRIDCGAMANRNIAKVKTDGHADPIQRC